MNWKEIIKQVDSNSIYSQERKEIYEKESVLPSRENLYRAFDLCEYDNTKVVILGQDPYPDKQHAHGLAFSSSSFQTPASLHNIFKEIKRSLFPEESWNECFKTNNLECWAKQGVLLLNTSLTVREGAPNSHSYLWTSFTVEIMDILMKHPNPLVYLLWGNSAREYKRMVGLGSVKFETSHPSPLSVHRGFLGCDHFVLANEFLYKNYGEEILWKTWKI